MSQIASFRQKLASMKPYLDEAKVTELVVNKPFEMFVARQGQGYMERIDMPELSYALLESLADVTASYSSQETDRERPLLSATMPIDLSDGVDDTERGGYRVQVVKAPAVGEKTMALCIRKPSLLDLTIEDYKKQGAFNNINEKKESVEYSNENLTRMCKEKDWEGFLRGAVLTHKNIVVSAGTNTGKTTFLNALLKTVPDYERIVTIEDSREIRPPQPNCLHLLYSRGGQGVSKVSAIDLLEASLRLTPDRIIMGELRGAEAYSYLEMLNTGAGGSITTIHSNSPAMMYERLSMMVLRAGIALNQSQIIDYAKSLIQVVVQFSYDKNSGRRFISEILYEGN
ncbi:ATPase required for both assembly of type IV secretion complex and secretion of T-DNA complex, VirB11 (plasmid) [Collimonas arenae]|uniref:Type IV secretion system protein n=1 Tax=Collimonas arenae TaxID=279058 RepID=A0A0A1FKE0_9BURK|nr:P-type DNA transfer ATPase VirB11 [Collimonas arenae]AIY44190.1 ATPase required for both assembly of type IV secretion complex and secretion of T-DNA complex, VirB11 [Collimonas arenae]